MDNIKRDIILLIKEDHVHPDLINRQVRLVNELMGPVESLDSFCAAHELLCRNRITSKKGKIIKALQDKPLKPFWFFINKN